MSGRKKGGGASGGGSKASNDSSPSKAPVDTSAMFADLLNLQASGDFDKALKVTNKILNVHPADTDAFHCKVVCLLQLHKFEDVLKQVQDNEKIEVDLTFERAYALYRLNRVQDSFDLLQKVSKPDERIKELKAQVLYRLERYEDCFSLYRELIRNTSDDFEMERLTNLSAVSSYLTDKNATIVEEDETYELVYNKACHLLAQSKWAEAEKCLQKSLKMCTEFLQEEEESQEDIDKETGIIQVQIGFCMQVQGREKEAQAIYNQVLKTKPTDIGLVAVASNNLLTLNKDQNIFDSKKRVKAAMADGLEHKLTMSHQRTIARNNALLAMYTNQVDLCRTLIKEVSAKFGLENEDKALIEAGVLARSGKTKDAVTALLGPNKKSTDLERLLIASQIYLEKGEVAEALGVFQALPAEDKYRTGILSAMVTLCLALEDRVTAAKLLKEAVTYNKKGGKADGKKMVTVWRKAAEFHLKGDEPSVAAQSLEELLKMDPGNRQTLAQLVLAYSKFNLTKALEVSKRLPNFTHGNVDVDNLESGAFLGAKGAAKKAGVGAKGAASPKPKTPIAQEEEVVKKKKKKNRKKRHLPKNYNPDVDPDPERWLPRRERTGYRKTRKERRKGEKFTGAQGTAAGQSDNYDYSQKVAAGGAVPKGARSPPEPEKPVGPRQQQRKPQQKKKTKKNRF